MAKPIFTDLHIHTSEDADALNSSYDVDLLIRKIKEFSSADDILISLTDHNTINKLAYENLIANYDINVVLGVELSIRNYKDASYYHCHAYFNLEKGEIIENIDAVNNVLNGLYPKKMVNDSDGVPFIDEIIRAFENYEILLLPHGGQSHRTFNLSLPKDKSIRFDGVIERNLYYNHFDGFTSQNMNGLDKTVDYFKKLGISEFINLITCTDNYNPGRYPHCKSNNIEYIPTWIIADPTFDGLRLALSDSSRLRYQRDKPEISDNYIHSVKLKNDKCDIDVNLTQGLNVIIGGSSSGKSLLIDSIYHGLRKDFETLEDNKYSDFGVDTVQINNPKGFLPHYISQNYIMEAINTSTRGGIETIDLLGNLFPNTSSIDVNMTNSLKEVKDCISNLLESTDGIEKLYEKIRNVQHPSSLIEKGIYKDNIFDYIKEDDGLLDSVYINEGTIEGYKKVLKEIKDLSTNPFMDNVNHEIEVISKALDDLAKKNKLLSNVLTIKNEFKDEYSSSIQKIKKSDAEVRSAKTNLLSYIRDFYSYKNEFYKSIEKLKSFTFIYETNPVQIGNYSLSVTNKFNLNSSKILSGLNSILTEPYKLKSFELIRPEDLFKDKRDRRLNNFSEKVLEKLNEDNKKIYKIVDKNGRDFDTLSPGWKTAFILDIVLSNKNDDAPILIDQPEDNLATGYINDGLVKAIKECKDRRQIIVVSHNATIPMLADAQNVIVCKNIDGKIIIRNSSMEGKIDNDSTIDLIANITDGGKSSIKKRVKKYNLKTYRSNENDN